MRGLIVSGPRPPLGGTVDQPSSRQLEYLQFLAGFTARHGVAPSFEEVATHFMVSAASSGTQRQFPGDLVVNL